MFYLFLLLISMIWIIGGIFSYASCLAMSDGIDPEEHRENKGVSIIVSILGGPIAFFVALIVGDYKKYGLKFR